MAQRRGEAGDAQRSADAHFAETAEFWGAVYGGHDLFAAIYRHRHETVVAVVDALALARPTRILELGCGAGLTTVALAARGMRLHALDPVDAMVRRTRERAEAAAVSDRVTVSRGDGRALAFSDGAFDLVLAIGVLPWVPSMPDVLREMVRVTAPGGHLVVSVDNRWRLHHVLDPVLNPAVTPLRIRLGDGLRAFGLRRSRAQPRSHTCSAREVRQLLEQAGLRVRRCTSVGFGPFSFLGWRLPDRMGLPLHTRLQALADRGLPLVRAGGANTVVLAEKALDTPRAR